jgi:glycosyltransferase involved in cell wall biosynthesis
MRILIVSTSEKTGGAALAANRLMEALKNNGEKAMMLVRDKETEQISVAALPSSWSLRWHFLWERWCVYWHLRFHREHLFDIDIANSGNDITRTREFQEADIIHLHWVNQGMLSLSNIRKILDSGKPVVWTMHDMWPATAICHLTLGCEQFHSRCSHCHYLPGSGGENDLASRIWGRKERMLHGKNILFVACSRWLATEAKKSGLLQGQKVVSIPNPIDLHVFHQEDKTAARQRAGLPLDKRLVLFVSQRVTNQNKGMSYLVEACRIFNSRHPETRDNTALVILGGHAEEVTAQFDMPVYPLGYVNDTKRIVDIYNAADLFVLPSLSENLPNTIMEAMACGVPCVGFKVGGIPEEIDHLKNGYVAEYKNADDLARGIRWILDEANLQELSAHAIGKVASTYSQQRVALKYIEVYSQAAAYIHYRL